MKSETFSEEGKYNCVGMKIAVCAHFNRHEQQTVIAQLEWEGVVSCRAL